MNQNNSRKNIILLFNSLWDLYYHFCGIMAPNFSVYITFCMGWLDAEIRVYISMVLGAVQQAGFTLVDFIYFNRFYTDLLFSNTITIIFLGSKLPQYMALSVSLSVSLVCQKKKIRTLLSKVGG